MTKQTKSLLALAVVGVAAYFILRQKGNQRNASGTARGAGYKFQLLQEYIVFPVQQCGRTVSTRGYKLKTGDIIIANAYTCWNGDGVEYGMDGNIRNIHTTIAGLSGDVIIPGSVARLIST